MRKIDYGSKRQISLRAGIDPSFLHRILSGERRPSSKVAIRLAKVTGIPAADWIFSKPADLRKRVEEINPNDVVNEEYTEREAC